MPNDPRLRPLDAPRQLRVRTDVEGRPVETHGRRVVAVREVWRIDDEWWRLPISRLYYEAVLENGTLLTLYHDLAEGGWWEQ